MRLNYQRIQLCVTDIGGQPAFVADFVLKRVHAPLVSAMWRLTTRQLILAFFILFRVFKVESSFKSCSPPVIRSLMFLSLTSSSSVLAYNLRLYLWRNMTRPRRMCVSITATVFCKISLKKRYMMSNSMLIRLSFITGSVLSCLLGLTLVEGFAAIVYLTFTGSNLYKKEIVQTRS